MAGDVPRQANRAIVKNTLTIMKSSKSAKTPIRKPAPRSTKSTSAQSAGSVSKVRSSIPTVQTDPAVGELIRKLKHPMKSELEQFRSLILALSPDIREEIKWNSPSYKATDHFATINVHGQDCLRLILHKGAKVKDNATKEMKIEDPDGLLKWLARDRAMLTFDKNRSVQSHRKSIELILRDWMRHL